MDRKTEKKMAKMVDAVQPHCEEEIIAAMTCSHAGSMRSVLVVKAVGMDGVLPRSSPLPNPVFIAVGTDTVYAFAYKPRGFKFKIKKEIARWPRDEVSVTVKSTVGMTRFDMTMSTGETYPLEVPTIMGGEELVRYFLDKLSGS